MTERKIDEGELAQIASRLRAATPGPWEALCYDSGHSQFEMSCSVITADVGDQVCTFDAISRLGNERHGRNDGHADAVFVAHAPTDIARLLAEVRRAHDRDMDVRALHRERDGWCVECSKGRAPEPFPCMTITILD